MARCHRFMPQFGLLPRRGKLEFSCLASTPNRLSPLFFRFSSLSLALLRASANNSSVRIQFF